ncbi:MAG: hypothetical protein WCJ81_09385 [bacterium]
MLKKIVALAVLVIALVAMLVLIGPIADRNNQERENAADAQFFMHQQETIQQDRKDHPQDYPSYEGPHKGQK